MSQQEDVHPFTPAPVGPVVPTVPEEVHAQLPDTIKPLAAPANLLLPDETPELRKKLEAAKEMYPGQCRNVLKMLFELDDIWTEKFGADYDVEERLAAIIEEDAAQEARNSEEREDEEVSGDDSTAADGGSPGAEDTQPDDLLPGPPPGEQQ